ALIHQWTYTGANNQWWAMYGSSYGDSYIRAISVNSNKCMGVQGGSTQRGASVLQWSCNGAPDQAWTWAWTGYYAGNRWPIFNIVNLNSHMCLGITGASLQVGADAVQWTCNGSADQEWY
ncbi:MAG TPA: RICIN domain-containing protein, partial [Ktedonobacteraceae bacterium]|nr:RICIN domain-containing protein [Ktedonobacteraceae bacterium]